MIISLLFYIFVAVTAIQLVYHICFTTILFDKNTVKKSEENLPISVLICAKNEAENLKKNLDAICNQNYPNFEIVLINDSSTDETLAVMERFKEKFSNIKIVDVAPNESFWGNKKYALTLGIKATENEHLLFTDADCNPESKHWITKMVSHFSEKKTIVLGYGKYQTKNNSLLSLLVRFETLLTAVQYFSYAKLGNPYMGVGRNLAYKKSEFFSVNGFIKHIKINSGDDDLFIQQTAKKENTAICLAEESFTISDAPETFKAWFHQKRRHVSTANFYKLNHKILLGLFYATKVLFYVLAIFLLFTFDWKMIIPSILTYWIVMYVAIGLSTKKLNEQKLIWSLPFLEICLLCFQFTIFIANTISKPKTWK